MEEVQEKVVEYLNAYMQMDQFSGSIIIAKKGEILVNKGYGFADAEFDIKNNPETKFRIGSLTKAFTAVAILQLEEKGLLKVDDKLQKYISDYPRGDEIAVRNLLTHTSGIPNHTEFEDFNKERRVYKYNIEETISTFKNRPLKFNPGEKFDYSNSNYILLGFENPEILKSIKLTEDILQLYIGKYELQPNFIFDISLSNGKLFCQPTGQSKLELVPISESEFYLKEVDAKISFSRNSNQEIDKLFLHQGDEKIPANKIK